MRTAMTTSVILAGVLLAGGASTAYAQSVLVADIPFDFRIAGATHPAGRYELRTMTTPSSSTHSGTTPL